MALVDNKEKIQALLAGINALPEAGSGEPAEPVLQEKTVTPTEEAQSITPDTGYDGLSKVNVDAIPDEYIVPSGTADITANGTHDVREVESVNVNVPVQEITLQEKTVTPTESAQTVTPDSGYDGLSKVTVEGVSAKTATVHFEMGYGYNSNVVGDVTASIVTEEGGTTLQRLVFGGENNTDAEPLLLENILVGSFVVVTLETIIPDFEIEGEIERLSGSNFSPYYHIFRISSDGSIVFNEAD